MPNPATLKVTYDEDVDSLTDNEIQTQLEKEISEVEDVTNVTVGAVFSSRPYGAIVDVEFDGMNNTTSENIEYRVSTLDFVHNAAVK